MDKDEVIELLKKKVKTFPTKPGVYLMKDEKGKVIYVGKAKSLRVRVRNYLGVGDGRSQIQYLMRRVMDIETIVTESEHQAFILEKDLITKYKPRYNIRLKDDKAYLSVRIDDNAEWPRLELVRRVEQDGARYFGPYTFSYELRTLLDIINRVVPLRSCTNTVFHNRQRPCLEYQIKRCAGPCCLEVDPDEYQEWVKQAMKILEGKTDEIVDELTRRMAVASNAQLYEDAAVLRDRIELLRKFKEGRHLLSSRGENRDVFALYRDERLAALSILMVRNGRVANNVNFSFTDVEVSDEEILEASLEQFYSKGREIPEEIVLPLAVESVELLRDELREHRGSAVQVTVPKRGVKFRLLGLARLNAEQHFRTRFDSESRYLGIARDLATRFHLRQVPRRVECFDISNLQGESIVGAHVVYFDGRPMRDEFRRYKISQQGKPDDFAAMYEVVERRLARAQEEGAEPDLLVIDGGKGQLSMACKARDALGIEMDIVGLAKMKSEKMELLRKQEKKPERVFLEGSDSSIPLDRNSETTKFLQRIRDEVHRYVISYHRKSRSKSAFGSILDAVAGIGPERKRRLLREYGSVERMKGADPRDLARAGRMSIALAEKLLSIIE